MKGRFKFVLAVLAKEVLLVVLAKVMEWLLSYIQRHTQDNGKKGQRKGRQQGKMEDIKSLLREVKVERLFSPVEQHVQGDKKSLTSVWQKYKRKLAAKAARFIYQHGYNKGHKRGKREGIENTVKRMLAGGMSDDQICDLLQLNKRELDTLVCLPKILQIVWQWAMQIKQLSCAGVGEVQAAVVQAQAWITHGGKHKWS